MSSRAYDRVSVIAQASPPHAVAPLLDADAARSSWAPLDRARVLDAFADALVAAKEPGAATDARLEGVRLRALPGSGASTTDTLLGHVGVADTATKALRFDEAFAAIKAARAVLRGKESASARAGLLRAEATVADCAGDSARANALLDAAGEVAPLPNGPLREPAHVTVALDRVRFLRRFAAAPGTSVAAAARAGSEADRLSQRLVDGGAYANAAQLPRTFTRGLPPGRPWHSFARSGGGYPELRPLRALLERSAPALRDEFRALASGGHLLAEQECIHDPSPPLLTLPRGDSSGERSAVPSRLGSWRYFTANGPWMRGLDELRCAASVAPVACRVLAEATALRAADGATPLARVLRVGYSALAGSGSIRPHCGMTNTQLKLHVGLVTPQRPGGAGACAALTVGNETRAWEEGKVGRCTPHGAAGCVRVC